MIRILTLIVVVSLIQSICATDWDIPEPVTYEWTVKATQRVLPVVDLKDTTIKSLIGYMGNSMTSPIGLKHNIPDSVLEKKVSWQFKNIKWIDLVAKIADTTSSDIKIEKGVVRLIYKKFAEQGGADDR